MAKRLGKRLGAMTNGDGTGVGVRVSRAESYGVRRGGVIELSRERIRRLGLAKRTEHAYMGWIVRFLRAFPGRRPEALGQ